MADVIIPHQILKYTYTGKYKGKMHSSLCNRPLEPDLSGLQGRPKRERKISPIPRFDPRTDQPVASRYTDWATPAHKLCVYGEKEGIETPKFRQVVTFVIDHK